MRFSLFGLAGIVAVLGGAPAWASSSDWHETTGGRVRLVTSGLPDAQGHLAGALQVELQPGWKTYWRDPGGSGVPPSIDVSANPLVASAEIDFPTPEHHFDGTSTWAGYSNSVVFPVTFGMRASGAPGPISAAVFLGICETICVPVQGNLVVDPERAPDDPADAAIIEAARAALPAKANPEFGVVSAVVAGKQVIVEIQAPSGFDQFDLFLSGGDGYMFGPPKLVPGKEKTTFAADIITRPKTTPTGPGLHYTLATRSGAVAGLIPYF